MNYVSSLFLTVEGIGRINLPSVFHGENAIAGFSSAGLIFAGGEMPVRLICQPYFCQWKIAGLGLPVTNCQILKFSVVLLPVTAICQWQIDA